MNINIHFNYIENEEALPLQEENSTGIKKNRIHFLQGYEPLQKSNNEQDKLLDRLAIAAEKISGQESPSLSKWEKQFEILVEDSNTEQKTFYKVNIASLIKRFKISNQEFSSLVSNIDKSGCVDKNKLQTLISQKLPSLIEHDVNNHVKYLNDMLLSNKFDEALEYFRKKIYKYELSPVMQRLNEQSTGNLDKFMDKLTNKEIELLAEINPRAQCRLAFMYDFGKGIEQSAKNAMKYYQLAVDQGDAEAQSRLAYKYSLGRGVQKNAFMAVKYWQLSAEQGYAPAQRNLGSMYQRGDGVEQNDKTAVKYFQLAADQGDDSALSELGYMYKVGRGVEQNAKLAEKYYQLASEQRKKQTLDEGQL